MAAASPSPSPSSLLPLLRRPDSAALRQQADDDDVVCAFGPDYYRGAALGAGVGSLCAASLCYYTFSLLRADQREVDFVAGLRRGQRNHRFSPWTILRGLRTQPMLTVGCVALAATSTMKCIKCCLATGRCREFYKDDREFALLLEACETKDNPRAQALLTAIEEASMPTQPAPVSPLSSKVAAMADLQKPSAAKIDLPTAPAAAEASRSPSSLQALLHAHGTKNTSSSGSGSGGAMATTKLIHRSPTFWDGVAVAFLGSVMDCYLPQKPVQRYYNMRAGMD